jgi:transcriptional regulator with XRE-family HTH domain
MKFTQEQQSIINGSLLGDGSIGKQRYGNSHFSKCQSSNRREYLEWHSEKLEPFSCSINEYDNYAKGKLYKKTVFTTHASDMFTELRHKWYPEGKKIVPRDLTLDQLSIAIWFFDDGSNCLTDRQCKFATYCFSKNDCEYLSNQLVEHNIKSYITKQNVIGVRAESYKTLIDLISPYMLWDCFEYKIQYKDSNRKFISDEDAYAIVEYYKNGKTQQEIADILGVSINPISSVLRGVRKKHLNINLTENNLHLSNTSGYKNVSWDKSRNKWAVSFQVAGKNRAIGRYTDKTEAIAVANAFRLELENDNVVE